MTQGLRPPQPVLTVRDLTLGTADQALVEGLSFELRAGERVGLVGESGSGKTLTGLAVLGLLPAGLNRWSGDMDPRPGTGRLAMVFQEPLSALNPVLSLGFQISEALRQRHGRLPKRRLRQRGIELLRQVAMPDPDMRWQSFPHQLSGGQRQRAMLAMALALEPVALIADEPTTALDVTVQSQMLDLLTDLNRRTGLAILLITHDWGVVARMCERVLVMDQGRLVEQGALEQIYHRPSHPKTLELLAASGGGRSAPEPRS